MSFALGLRNAIQRAEGEKAITHITKVNLGVEIDDLDHRWAQPRRTGLGSPAPIQSPNELDNAWWNYAASRIGHVFYRVSAS